jgi:hypothetical protein
VARDKGPQSPCCGSAGASSANPAGQIVFWSALVGPIMYLRFMMMTNLVRVLARIAKHTGLTPGDL